MPVSNLRIHDLLPHRHPFLFVDEILFIRNGQSIKGVYRVPGDHPFLNRLGDAVVFPSTFAVEALGQVAAVCIRLGLSTTTSGPIGARAQGFLVRIDQCSFYRPMHAEEELELSAGHVARYGPLHKYDTVCEVAGKTVVQAALTLYIDL